MKFKREEEVSLKVQFQILAKPNSNSFRLWIKIRWMLERLQFNNKNKDLKRLVIILLITKTLLNKKDKLFKDSLWA